jgi:thiamine pyrophosphokinase
MCVMGRVVVVVNGRFAHEARLLDVVDSAEVVIAADGGANWLGTHGRTPHQVVGDMDSVDAALLLRLESAGCRIDRYPARKDETDAELALAAAAALDPGEITILGALGGRIDHTLGNLSLLSMGVLRGLSVRVYDGLSTLWLVSGETEVRGVAGDLVSLIPWGGDACGIRTEGLEYSLHNETLRFGPSRGISNVLLKECARVSVRAGQLLMVHTPRAALEGEA